MRMSRLMRKTRFMMHYDCSNDENDGWWEKPRFIMYCGSSSEDVMIHEENQVCVLTSGMRMWWSMRKTWFMSWLQWWGCNNWGGKMGVCCVDRFGCGPTTLISLWRMRMRTASPIPFAYLLRTFCWLVINYLSFYNNWKFYMNSWWAPHFEMIPKRCGHK